MSEQIFEGDVARVTNFEHIAQDGKTKVRWKCPKGKVFVVMLLGLESKVPTKDSDLLQGKDVLEKIMKLEDGRGDEIEAEITSISGVTRSF